MARAAPGCGGGTWLAGGARLALCVAANWAAAGVAPAGASESLFGYSYTTDLLPKSRWELEQWSTAALGKSQGDYQRYDFRSEVEYGVTDNFQVALYGNYYLVNAYRSNTDGTTSGKRIPENADPYARYTAGRFESASFEMIYRVLSPYTDPIGLALYLEPTVGPEYHAIEGRIIVQKNLFDDRLVLAGNLWVEPETRVYSGQRLPDPAERETARRWVDSTELELDLGASYRVAPNWFLGVEARNHNEMNDVFGTFNHSAFFLGPTVHYAGERFWATLTLMPQLPLASPYTPDQRDVTAGHRLYGDEHEKLELRLKLGWVF